MLRAGKVAIPATAATVVEPESVPPAGFVPSATVTVPVKPAIGLPCASCAVTWTAGVIGSPATVDVGSTVKSSCVALGGPVTASGQPDRSSESAIATPPERARALTDADTTRIAIATRSTTTSRADLGHVPYHVVVPKPLASIDLCHRARVAAFGCGNCATGGEHRARSHYLTESPR